jgi:exodeoxyribonuclease V gamma subunit
MYFFGFVNFKKLQEVIIDDVTSINDITFLMLEESEDINDYSIISAPSLLREIETVHSKICELVNTSNANYSDFLVLAPNISIYEGVIPRVFNQDNISFPSIPYSINDKKKVVTNVTSGLRKLIEIFSKGYYTRYDFFELVNNPDIKQARNISDEDVDTFTNSILSIALLK